jgi:hypothetical protein
MNTPIIPDDDFWSRQANAQRYSFSFAPLGARAEITTNVESVLLAARLAAARYCQSEPYGETTLRIQIIVRQQDPPPLPGDWPERLIYSGTGPWLTLSAGEWGHGFGNLDLRAALLFLSPTLAAETQLVSRYFIDHYLLNFLFNDWAMLHASGVVDPSGQTLVLMVGAHNAGKSTTALRLARAGYHLLADGMALMQLRAGRIGVSGYPLGEVKLRDDVLAEFPEYSGETVKVREHHKTVVNLWGASAHSNHIVESVLTPATIHLCFTERGPGPATTLTPFAPETARDWLAANTVFWDEPARLEHNTQVLNHLLDMARLHHLTLGADPVGVISTLEKLR